ncbi:tRNA-dependent cyclodipeptide synthase [Streptomyces sp. LP05-1]|uniref:Cyclodipeptide synthase n=1 Tax=Streptomyces pyxinae TaxID=2970734 RepID=A0ABT2CGB0_9ACTN|nr:tRNA-dependent cyclodipeptide synthase [Streptomyces sp. LP05-1]MCS0636460.1 tRNA-dependent cyclodipeptide synthase [Streptomyces sp. LP05-1]
MTSRFLVRHCSPESAILVERAESVVLGLSPWNGYYRPRAIEALIDWACSVFRRVDVFVPGYEAAHTLTAAGFTAPEAVHRTRRALSQLRTPARRALERAGVDGPDRHLHTWTQLAGRPQYAASRARAEHAYRTDPAVRRVCRATARAAVRHAAGTEPSEAQIDRAVSYTIAELPLVVDGPAVFGTTTSLFVYHRPMDLLEPLITGEARGLRPAPGQGYAVVTPAGTDQEGFPHDRRQDRDR